MGLDDGDVLGIPPRDLSPRAESCAKLRCPASLSSGGALSFRGKN